MTPAEWLEFSYSQVGNATDGVATIITMASAYLITAYLVGKKLTRQQVVLLNTIFVPGIAFFSYGPIIAFRDGLNARSIAAERIPELQAMPDSAHTLIIYFLSALFGSVIIVCLKFMWDVRNPKDADS